MVCYALYVIAPMTFLELATVLKVQINNHEQNVKKSLKLVNLEFSQSRVKLYTVADIQKQRTNFVKLTKERPKKIDFRLLSAIAFFLLYGRFSYLEHLSVIQTSRQKSAAKKIKSKQKQNILLLLVWYHQP
jgi:hypothetical protein